MLGGTEWTAVGTWLGLLDGRNLGTDSGALTSGESKQEAILSVLTPEQRKNYQAQREAQRLAAQKEMESIGLTLPDDWSGFDDFDF